MMTPKEKRALASDLADIVSGKLRGTEVSQGLIQEIEDAFYENLSHREAMDA